MAKRKDTTNPSSEIPNPTIQATAGLEVVDRVASRKLLAAVNELGVIGDLVIAAEMASADLAEDSGPMATLLGLIAERVVTCRKTIDEARPRPSNAAAADTEQDPVFAAIEGHRNAEERSIALLDQPEDDVARTQASEAEGVALAKLMEAAPTTLSGVRAAIAYFVEWDKANARETSGAYMPTLLRSPVFAT